MSHIRKPFYATLVANTNDFRHSLSFADTMTLPEIRYISTVKRILSILLAFIALTSHAQTYWQQHIDTRIRVQLDDVHNVLNGYEELTYTNHSPDTLRFIYMHLFPNAYKNDKTPFAQQLDINRSTAFYYSRPEDKGYMDSLRFTVNGNDVDVNATDNAPDIARIDLQQPLLPGASINIATPFRVKIPIVFSRMGHTGQAYYISQWFPKPAVYDRKGWHPISYLDQGEFYSDYGSYDVTITLPKNYILLATGNCADAAENAWMDELSKKPLPADTFYRHDFPPSALQMKTVHYTENNVHDFAWFADKRWIVRKDTVTDPVSHNIVTTWAAYLPASQKAWSAANNYLKETIRHYGSWVGSYPYKTIKAVQGDMKAGGGMEYPTITLIDRSATAQLETTVIHEGGHNWFYGMLGTNERDHAWMDEGINTFYEQKTTEDLKSRKDMATMIQGKGISLGFLNEDLLYIVYAAMHRDQAIEQTSANFRKLNYGVDVYYKTALMLRWLEAYMGPDDFEKGMKAYYAAWHHKHPYPGDLQACLQQNTKKDVSWFFDVILHTDKKIDFKITNAKVGDHSTEVTVQNNTGVMSPAKVDVYNRDSLVYSFFTDPTATEITQTIPVAALEKMVIDRVVPDAKTTNNEYRRSSMFHDFGLKLKPVLGLNISHFNKIFLSPAVGYNQYDGTMLGILLHDLSYPQDRFRYAIAPLYSFETNKLVGTGSVDYMWYPNGLFSQILLQADAKTFHYNETGINLSKPLYAGYTKIAPSLHFTFTPSDALSTVERTLTLKTYFINEQNFTPDPITAAAAYQNPGTIPVLQSGAKTYGLIRYTHNNDRTYNPFSYDARVEGNGDYAKISAEGKIRVDYNAKNKALYVRAFAGKFFPINNDPAVTDRYQFNAGYSGVNDYLYDDYFLGRNAMNNLAAQQITIQDGGFKIPVFSNADRSDNWMTTVNLSSDLPRTHLPVRLFFDAGLIPNADPTLTNSSATTLLYDGGVSVRLFFNAVTVYVPFIMSNDFQNYLSNSFGHKNVFARSISFTINIQDINWLLLPEWGIKKAEDGM